MQGRVDSLVFSSSTAPVKGHSTPIAGPQGEDPALPTGTSCLDPLLLCGTAARDDGPGVEPCDAFQLPVLFGMRCGGTCHSIKHPQSFSHLGRYVSRGFHHGFLIDAVCSS